MCVSVCAHYLVLEEAKQEEIGPNPRNPLQKEAKRAPRFSCAELKIRKISCAGEFGAACLSERNRINIHTHTITARTHARTLVHGGDSPRLWTAANYDCAAEEEL